jgi:hypothetical protein
VDVGEIRGRNEDNSDVQLAQKLLNEAVSIAEIVECIGE